MPIGVDHDALQYISISYSLVGKNDEDIYHQKRLLEDFARRNGLPNPTHFTDDGISGTRFVRPGFLAMMEEVEAGRVEAIVIKDYCAIIGLNQKDLENQGILA